MSEELKDIMKKIEELREDINKMVLDNSLGDKEVINKSRIMDWHLNRYQELINSKNIQLQARLNEVIIKRENLDDDLNDCENKILEDLNKALGDFSKKKLEEMVEEKLDVEKVLVEGSEKFSYSNIDEYTNLKTDSDKNFHKELEQELEKEIEKQLQKELEKDLRKEQEQENRKEEELEKMIKNGKEEIEEEIKVELKRGLEKN